MEEGIKTFVEIEPDKERHWVTDVYYGQKGKSKYGHLSISGGHFVGEGLVVNDVLMNVAYEELLFHRDANGRILFDEGIF